MRWAGRMSGRRAVILFALLVAICYGQVVWWFIFQLQRSREVERLQVELLQARRAAGLVTEAAGDAGEREARQRTRHRTRMFVAEGSFFLLAISAGLGFIAWSYRHERALKRRQDELLGAVSHEFNTPLQSLRLSLDSMAGRELSPERWARSRDRMSKDVDRLARMVDELLHIQRLEAAVAPPPVAVCELGDVVACALERLRPGLQAEGFAVEVAADGPAVVRCHSAELSYAVELLLDNAVKYAAAGRWAGVSYGPAPGGRAFLRVCDRGPGLGAGEASLVFEKFGRGAAARQGTVPGTGLGLSIVRRIVADHGGRVTAGPGPGGVGACFEIVLPAAAGPDVLGGEERA